MLFKVHTEIPNNLYLKMYVIYCVHLTILYKILKTPEENDIHFYSVDDLRLFDSGFQLCQTVVFE